MKLNPIHKIFTLPSLYIYSFLITRQLYYNYPSLKIRNSNLILLNSIYLFETLVAIVFKKSILYNWQIKDYLQHHVILSFFMLLYYNFGYSLDKYFTNMQKYCILINSYEITSLSQNFNLSVKLFIILKCYSLYNLLNLSYYEVSDSFVYYKSINSNKKYFALLPFFAMLYHIIIVLPSTMKYIKNNLK